MKQFKRILITLICLLCMFADISIPANVIAAETTAGQPVYNESTGYYVLTKTSTTTEYDIALNCYVTIKKTITYSYNYVNGTYVLKYQSEDTQVTPITPQATSSPEGYPTSSPTYNPLASSSPDAYPTMSPTPTSSPVVFTMDKDAVNVKAKRVSNKKARLTWETVDEATGYIIYKSAKENSGYKKVKTITDPYAVSYSSGGLSKNKVYYYKVYAYQTVDNETCLTDEPDPEQVSTITVKKITEKLKSLKKKYPNGKYWNHVGYRVSKGQNVTGFITDRPCNHTGCSNGVAGTCNYYLGTDRVLGYQCSGYASLLSDKIFGKAKYRKHTSFSKAKVGDVVRYSGHSVLITEKHTDYIVVTECNYGNTCIIKWGRKIAKTKLTGAVYRTRY